ncbi:histidine phosphatase family protein [Crassaminicella thermophila]|uniref:Histidine phosphatase family protein n=1 Tax=Crassaminicella thermophila TaxID=2599308 RepID=A0A5C0SC91_CRATE|nr:histidine phosphatase family protein [Crassaminicella thermophila]QEK12183.1 histidine phosphatase family protein [Crassaminicella thermophila]
MTKLYLIRHGQTKWNTESRAQGSINVALSKEGRYQATLLANRMKNYEIDCIYSSDLDRAYETAVILGEKLNTEVKKISGLREMSFGEWEGLTHENIKKNYLEHYTVWRSKPHEANIPGGEKLIDVQKRGLETINDIITENKGKNIMVVSHGVTIKSIILGIMDIDLSNFYKIRQDNTCVNLIEYRDYGPVIVTLNDTAHLENIK